MKTALPALVLLLSLVGELRAQVLLVNGPPPGAGINFSFFRGRVYGGFTIGGYGPGFYRPGWYGPGPYPPPPPYYGGVRVTNVIVYSPPLYVPPLVVPPLAIPGLAPPASDLRDEDFPDKIVIRPGQGARKPAAAAQPLAPPLPPGEPAGQFRPLAPGDRERAQPPAEQPAARQPEPAPEPLNPLPRWVPDLPVPQPPKLDAPLAERYLALGKTAFASQEYARAERRFRQAIAETPKEPLGHFYLAQAQFALGKFQDAHSALQAALQLRPTWPTGSFRSRALYVLNGADFVEHMKALEEALRRRGEDPALLFVYGYQLWFDGREEQARVVFRQAEPLVANPRYVQLFLQAVPLGPVVAR